MKASVFIVVALFVVAGCGIKSSDSQATNIDTTGVKEELSITTNKDQAEFIEKLDAAEGLTAVKNESGWGFIDELDNIVIPCQYTAVSSFSNGKAVVSKSSDQENWREGYYFIDAKGKSLAKFFEPLMSKSDCESAMLVGSNETGERNATFRLTNCPDGKQSYVYQGWEWGNEMSYFPGNSISGVITELADSQHEHASIFKKFNGEELEFQEGDDQVNFSVIKNDDGTIRELKISIASDYHSSEYVIILEGGGVLVRKNHGS